jgi:UDP-glucuronate 4-epimerase
MFRFFTVYGPWGRPDMALFKFTKAILEGKPIDVYNHGDMKRDFTYVTDLVEAIRLLLDAVPERPTDGIVSAGDSLSPVAPHRVVNIGNSNAVQLTDFIAAIEAATGLSAEQNLMPMQPGDVPATWADASLLQTLTGYKPKTSVPEGVAAFVAWYRDYYQIDDVPSGR